MLWYDVLMFTQAMMIIGLAANLIILAECMVQVAKRMRSIGRVVHCTRSVAHVCCFRRSGNSILNILSSTKNNNQKPQLYIYVSNDGPLVL